MTQLTLFRFDLFSQDRIRIEGTVIDSSTKMTLANVNVVVKDTFIGASTDSMGHYVLHLPNGRYTVRFTHIGYKVIEPLLIVESSFPWRLDIALEPTEIQLGTVTVEAHQPDDHIPSRYRISNLTARNVPPLGEPDPLRAVALLPGISQPNDLTGGLNIRGGSSDQNQVLLDGVEIYNPYHLAGLFSAFNFWAVENVEVYTANFPGRFGDRLGGVISVATKEPQDTSIVIGNISLLSSSLFLNHSWKNTFLLLAGRRTYLDLVTGLLGRKIPYHFYDLNFKLTQKLSSTLSVGIIGFANVDAITSSGIDDLPDPQGLRSGYSWGNRMAALRLTESNNKVQHTLVGYYSDYFIDANYKEGRAYVKNTLQDFTLRFDSRFQDRTTQGEFGAAYKSFRLKYDWNTLHGIDIESMFYDGAPPVYRGRANRGLVNVYLSGQHIFSPVLALEGSVRISTIDQPWTSFVSPRMNVLWLAGESSQITGGIGRYYQFIAEGREGIEESIGGLLFILERPMSASNASLGGTFGFLSDYELNGEVYHRIFHNLVRLNQTENETIEFPSFEFGSGIASGVDCLLEKKRGRATFQIAYSFLKSKVIFNGVSYTPDWDVTHSLKGIFGLRFGATWIFNAAFTYRSGTPFTPVVGKFFAAGSRGKVISSLSRYWYQSEYFIEGSKNSARLPAYSRLDVSIRKEYRWEKSKMTLYIQALNLLFRKNVLRYEWERYYNQSSYTVSGDDFEQGVATSLPIIPSIGVEIEF